MKYLRYLNYVLKHKWYVFLECCKAGHFWLGIIHDWSKFRPSEFFPYAEHFYGKGRTIKSGRDKTGYYKAGDSGEESFDFAWLLHQKRNRHHWQWWILPMDDRTTKLFDIGYRYLDELVCDWKGAGRAQKSKLTVLEYYRANREKIQLSNGTRNKLEILLHYLD